MLSKLKMRMIGVVLLPIGGLLTLNNWSVVQTDGNVWKLGAFIFPMLFFVGLMTLLVPVDRDALLAKYGVEAPKTMGHYTFMQKVIVIGGVVLSVINYAAVEAMAHGLF